MPFLIVQEDGRPKKNFPLLQETTIIGRVAECDIRISDHKSSRQHLRVFCKDAQYFAEDLKSSNGTLFNNKPLTEIKLLKFGDELKIGLTSIVFSAQEDVSETEPFTLTLYWQDSQQETKTFDANSLILGRLATNEICLQGKGVSGKHAEIKRNGTVLSVVDLESRNGIRVNGKVVKSAILHSEDILEIGVVKIRIDPPLLLPLKDSPAKELAPPKEIPLEGTRKITASVGGSTKKIKPQEVHEELPLNEIQLEEPPKTDLEQISERLSTLQESRSLQKKKNPFLLVVILLLTLLMPSIGGYWILQLLQQDSAEHHLNVPGNLISGNYSFELSEEKIPANEEIPFVLGTDWQLPKKTDIRLSTDSYEGRFALELGECTQPQMLRLVLVQQTFPADRAYELTGFLKLHENTGLAGLVVLYQNVLKKQSPGMEFSSFLQESRTEYQRLSFIFTPPPETNTIRVGFMTYGKSKSVLLDQLVLKEAQGVVSQPKRLSASPQFQLVKNAQGVFQLFYQNQLFLDKITLTLHLEARTLEQTFGSFEEWPANATQTGEGKLFDPVKNLWIPYRLTLDLQNTPKLQFQFSQRFNGNLGISWEINPFFFEESLLLVKETETLPFASEKLEENTIGIVFSSIQRIGLEFSPGTLIWKRSRGEAFFEYKMREPNANTFQWSLSLLDNVGPQDLKERLQKAKQAETRQKFGEALQQYQTLSLEFPFSVEGKQAKIEMDRLERQADQLLENLENQVKRALFFRQIRYLKQSLHLCQKLQEQYQDSRWGKFAVQLQNNIEQVLQESLRAESAEGGQLLLKRAEDFAISGYPSLAKVFYETILRKWPNTPESQTAEKQLQEGAK